MKYKYTLVLVIILILGGVSCKKDFLNTKIDTLVTPTSAATDRGTMFSFGNAVYTSLQYGFLAFDNNLFAAATDEAQESTTVYGTNYLAFNQGNLNANNIPDGYLYKNYYDGIRAANFFLDYSKNGNKFLALNRDTVTDAFNYGNDKLNLGWLRAEAHIARAYYYSELIKRWGGVPIITQTLQQTDNLYVAKSLYDDVVAYIVSEIDNNKAALQVNWKTAPAFATSYDGRFTLGAALAVKARVLLYAASPLHNTTNDVTKWQKAAAAAYDVINNDVANPSAKFNYALDASYGSYFTGANPLTSNETIFSVRRPPNNNPEVANYPISTAGGNSGLAPSDNLVADYEYTGAVNPANPYANRDPRLAASVVTNGSTWNNRTIDESPGGTDDMAKPNTSKTGYYLKKFLTDALNLTQGQTAQNQWVVFRYGQVLLDYAEAMNEAYGPDNANGYSLTARQALKKVRDRASTSLPVVTAGSQADFRTAIKHERRIELAFEDNRYWDLLRWKDAATVLNQPITGVTVTKSSTGVFSYSKVNVATRTFNAAANYYYPFAQAEIVNSKGTLVQNPGY
ncbi:MAG: RagB/SusD family nutrient uptake outer membrane protein [Bacteroidota bacterium]